MDAQSMGLSIMKPESRSHKIQSSLRFLRNLHEEISLAEKLSDIQDEAILNKLKEITQNLELEIAALIEENLELKGEKAPSITEFS